MSELWPVVEVASVHELDECIQDMDLNRLGLAWRGMSNAKWSLRSSLDRVISNTESVLDYGDWIRLERDTLETFRYGSLRFATDTERQFLMTPEGPGIWDIMALGRHCGLPTRLVDWTGSLWVAVYFASIDHPHSDGALWWFDQPELQKVVHKCWDNWGVPTHAEDPYFTGLTQEVAGRFGLHERALHAAAFADPGIPWITKIHFRMTFPRMEAQQGFMTACGRLGMEHQDAIDQLPNADSIPRGRIVMKAGVKDRLYERLFACNVDARSLLYPGMDIVARDLRAGLESDFGGS